MTYAEDMLAFDKVQLESAIFCRLLCANVLRVAREALLNRTSREKHHAYVHRDRFYNHGQPTLRLHNAPCQQLHRERVVTSKLSLSRRLAELST
eukprot:2700664-Pleurochrysis_carterae.AAC.2